MAAFLEDLQQFAERYPEAYDTDVREHLFDVVDAAVIKQSVGYSIPEELGMFSEEANAELAKILKTNIVRINKVFSAFKLDTQEKRRRSFFNAKLHTENGTTVDKFFGCP